MVDESIKKDEKNNNYKIAVFGSSLLLKGAKLIGIKYVYIDNGNENDIEKQINELFKMDSIGIVIINESTVSKIKNNKLLAAMESSLKPIFIEVPNYNEPELYTDMLRRLIIRAVGLDISKK
ncbi:MAG: hypothetical protein M1538_01995 [Candidatus Marsarchaeota archaeon]|jgi:vacuolar-type H+-ATPase subunit F/Vma7|nr:hypothetical protein [Candidatus Marsarchaeota archaeon]